MNEQQPERQPVSFLSPEQAQDLVAIGDRARGALSRFSGRDVAFDAESVQLLDEWIAAYVEADSDPPEQMRLLWATFLGELFRRRHAGWWAFRNGDLVIVCPTDGGDFRVVSPREHVDSRIAFGMSESLTYFYNLTRIELKLG